MALLVARGVEKSFGDREVLRGADLVIEPGERVGLVGANGSGKSTLLRILAGGGAPDHGEVLRTGRLGVLEQEPVLPGETVEEAAREAIAWHTALVAEYHDALSAGALDRAGALQDRLEQVGWSLAHRVEALLDRVGAPPPDARVETLSGGERRRVALVRALLGEPDLLLLDEPTNHLDADAVEWLQGYLAGYRGAVLLVTHDRYLLEAVATRIVEIEDGACISYTDCSYADYLVARAERQIAERRAEGRLLSLIEREAAWAARSPAARSTKQRARLQRLDALQEARPITRDEAFSLDFKSAVRLGSTILELHDASKSYGTLPILRELTLVLAPGDRLGVVGPNGIGKTTLLRIVAHGEPLDSGELLHGSRVRFGVLDQHRTGLNDDDTLFEAVGGGNDTVKVGERFVHVATFLERFLFPRPMFDQKVAGLSGGERARLLLASLLLKGANVLLLDFDGCALVVTHDRAFLDRACTGVLGFHGDGEVVRYADRLQYQAEVERRRAAAARAVTATPPPAAPAAVRPPPPRTKRSYKEQRELELLPDRIEAKEAEQTALEAVLADPATYKERADEVPALTARLDALHGEVAALYARWEQLGSD